MIARYWLPNSQILKVYTTHLPQWVYFIISFLFLNAITMLVPVRTNANYITFHSITGG